MSALVPQTYRIVAVDDLQPHPDNPHKGDLDVIRESVRENGFYGVVLVQQSRMRIIAGEHRWRSAREEGLVGLPAVLLDVTDEQAKRIMLADNRSAEFGGYDDQVLATLLQGLPDLSGTGWSDDDLTDLLDDLGGVEIVTDEPADPRRSAPPPAPEPETASSSRPGPPPPPAEEHDLEDEEHDDAGRADDAPPPRPKAGTTADLILTVTAAEHDELTDLLGKVRARDGEATTTQIIMAALRAYAA
ncbi:ParB/RepB/Spo0J family partition protein [Streptosporangium sp. OZ121]|uniref:ParB/RepB/Spo0J family partition protein n=1 Tax=Streptosporangium sp. OZ121 TaxID=3444183 RepID=UPI003F79E9DC